MTPAAPARHRPGGRTDRAPGREWRRPSPRMLLVHPLREAVRILPALAAVLLLGRHSPQLWCVLGLLIATAAGLLRWLGTSYRLTQTQILLRRGLVRRELLAVPRDRIRSVDATSGPYQRLLGLQRLAIGTGRSDRAGDVLVLDSLDLAAAELLRDELLLRVPRVTAQLPPEERAVADEAVTVDDGVISVFRPAWVRFGAVTLTGLAGAGVLLVSLTTFLNEEKLGPDQVPGLRQVVRQLDRMPAVSAAAVVAALALLAVSLLSAVRYAFSFGNFRLTRSADGTLRVTHGLTTTRSVTLEERRIAGVEVSATLPLRLLGGARCTAVTTGLRVGHGSEHGGSLLLPPAPLAEARRVAAAVSGGRTAVDCELTPHGVPARRRRIVRARAGALAAAGLLSAASWWAGAPGWDLAAALVLSPLSELLARDRYRNLGHALRDGRMVIGRGSLVRRRQVLREDAVVGWIFHASYFQRRAGLTTLTAATAAGRQYYNLPDVPLDAAVALADAARPGWLEPFLVSAVAADRS